MVSFLGPMNLCSQFGFSMLSLKVQRTLLSLLPWIGALDDAGGSWLEFGILTWILLSLFGSYNSLFWIWVIYIDYEGAKNPHVCIALNWGCQWPWRFLIRVWDLDLDLIKFVCSKFGFTLLSLKVQRTITSLLPWIGAVNDTGGSWLEFGILNLILLSLFWSDESLFHNWDFYV